MKRRNLIGAAVGAGAAVCANTPSLLSAAQPSAGTVRLAGKTLRELRDDYRFWLFDDFLPFMEKFVIDREYGGFMCTVDRDGTRLSEDKRAWYEGRGIWAWSFLYNNLSHDKRHLETARKSVGFILKHRPSGDNLWPETYARDGTPKGGPDARTYGDLFIALGLQEYAKATGDDSFHALAKDTVLKCIRLYDRPDYQPGSARAYLGATAPLMPGARVQGVWMCLINTITAMLERCPDPELEAAVRRSVSAVMDAHWNPDFNLTNELLEHDLSRPSEPISRLVYTGHAIETLWMIMFEAVRRKDDALFSAATDRFHRHVEVAWDDVYGGVFAGLLNVDENRWETNKVLWAQEEALIGSLFVYERTGAAWAKEWFERMYAYVMEHYPLKKHGYALWQNQGDRKMTFTPHYNRAENFHHPRHLMLNLLALDRMIARGGKPAGRFG